MSASVFPLYTIGYSSFSRDTLIRTLKEHSVRALVDVRSSPYSTRFKDFNKVELESVLKKQEIYYLFFGRELGARPGDISLYVNNTASFERMSQSSLFLSGCERLYNGLHKMSVCLMCAEKDPMTCHRTILICNNFRKLYPDVQIRHIMHDGNIEIQEKLDRRLMMKFDLLQEDLFRSFEERRKEAYSRQEKEIAYHFES